VVEEVFASPEIWEAGELQPAIASSTDCYEVESSILEAALDPVNPRPVAAVVTQPTWTTEDLLPGRPVLVAVELRDPGNLGTIMRTSEAAGFGGVVVVGDSVDPFSPKTVRASAGSVLRTPVVRIAAIDQAYDALRAGGRSVLAAVVDPDAEPYDRFDLSEAAIVVGNEPHGLSAEAIKLGDGRFTIPLSSSVESLNVAAAASVLCFEAARQRRAASDGLKSVGQ
jgi:TrmH family RNA methyltransferase